MGGGNIGDIIFPWDENRRYDPHSNYSNKHGFYVISYYNCIEDSDVRPCRPVRVVKIGIATTQKGINQRFQQYRIEYGSFNVIQVRTFDKKGEGDFIYDIDRARNYETVIKALLKEIKIQSVGTERYPYEDLKAIKRVIAYHDGELMRGREKLSAEEKHTALIGSEVKDKRHGRGEIVGAQKFPRGGWMWYVLFNNGHREPFGVKRIKEMIVKDI